MVQNEDCTFGIDRRPDMVQAGGKNSAGIPTAIEETAKALESQLEKNVTV